MDFIFLEVRIVSRLTVYFTKHTSHPIGMNLKITNTSKTFPFEDPSRDHEYYHDVVSIHANEMYGLKEMLLREPEVRL